MSMLVFTFTSWKQINIHLFRVISFSCFSKCKQLELKATNKQSINRWHKKGHFRLTCRRPVYLFCFTNCFHSFRSRRLDCYKRNNQPFEACYFCWYNLEQFVKIQGEIRHFQKRVCFFPGSCRFLPTKACYFLLLLTLNEGIMYAFIGGSHSKIRTAIWLFSKTRRAVFVFSYT